MRPRRARIQNFRSISDSGWFKIEQLTALVGINESGKTNILQALASLSSDSDYDPDLDDPRLVGKGVSPDSPVVTVQFELDDCDLELLNKANYNPAKGAMLEITKKWDGSLEWKLPDIPAKRLRTLDDDAADEVIDSLNNLRAKVRKYAERQDVNVDLLNRRRPQNPTPAQFESYLESQLKALRQIIQQLELADLRKEKFLLDAEHIEERLGDCFVYPPPARSPKEILEDRVPVFQYFADFSEFNGEINLETFVEYEDDPVSFEDKLMDAEDQSYRYKTIRNLFDLLEIDPRKLIGASPSARARAEDEMGRKARNVICPGWTQDIKINVRLDGKHIMIMVADIIQGEQQAATELRQRSRGFKTFLSFFLNCGQYLNEGAPPTVLLLDEPGLHLHADQQQELLDVFKSGSKQNVIIYSSHSPWMLPERALHTIKAVERGLDGSTIVKERWWESRSGTSLAIRKAIGITKSHELALPGNRFAIAVEGPADLLYLNWALDTLGSSKTSGLPGRTELAVFPAQGASRLPELIIFLQSSGFRNIVMLVDDDKEGLTAERDVLSNNLLEPEKIVLVSRALKGDPRKDVEIEDLIDEADLLKSVNSLLSRKSGGAEFRVSKKELTEVKKGLRTSRTWPALETLLEQKGAKKGILSKPDVAVEFYNLWESDPESISEKTERRFTVLLDEIRQALLARPE